MHHPTRKIDGEEVSFAHLATFTRKVQLELRGGLTKTVDVSFEFSCHCYSRGLADGEVASPGHEVPDGSKHKPRPRAFDRERYDLSLGLMAVIDELIASNGIVSRTRQERFHRVDQVETTRDGVKKVVSYFVFFHGRKVQAPGRPKSIRVVVESAYPEQDGIPHPSGRGSQTLGAMLGELWG
jgi:hypothetical protein